MRGWGKHFFLVLIKVPKRTCFYFLPGEEEFWNFFFSVFHFYRFRCGKRTEALNQESEQERDLKIRMDGVICFVFYFSISYELGMLDVQCRCFWYLFLKSFLFFLVVWIQRLFSNDVFVSEVSCWLLVKCFFLQEKKRFFLHLCLWLKK